MKVKLFPTTKMDRIFLWKNPQQRAEDINRAFSDPEIKGIISSIGGSDSVRILQYLDIPLIQKNPKFLMGYSDSTSFLSYLAMHDLVTFYGPSVMAGFAYLENFPEALEENRNVLFAKSEYALQAFPRWAEDYCGWEREEDIGELKEVYDTEAEHRWVNKGQKTKGRIWGGCIEILEMMVGTFAWPSMDFFKDTIVFIETSEDKPSPDHVACVLRNWGLQGILSQINGLLVAKPKAYSVEEKRELEENIKMIVLEEWGRPDMNIIMNMDIGHTEPRHIIPLGIELEIDPDTETLSFCEPLFVG